MPETVDEEVQIVRSAILEQDPTGEQVGQVIRQTFDQLYDGQNTGRYHWDQLYKTEKTHCGTLVEINLHRQFRFKDGDLLDYKIESIEVDCKYSQKMYGWMIPPEAVGQICLLLWANDEQAKWNMGIVRARSKWLGAGRNRDRKAYLSQEGRENVIDLFREKALPPNILLRLGREDVEAVMSLKHGTERVDALFRLAVGMRVGRAAVATVARQVDYMKRVRYNGGSRSRLRSEGYIILGQYSSHSAVARKLKAPTPGAGEFVSILVAPAEAPGPGVAEIDGTLWRKALPGDPVVDAPLLPEV